MVLVFVEVLLLLLGLCGLTVGQVFQNLNPPLPAVELHVDVNLDCVYQWPCMVLFPICTLLGSQCGPGVPGHAEEIWHMPGIASLPQAGQKDICIRLELVCVPADIETFVLCSRGIFAKILIGFDRGRWDLSQRRENSLIGD